MSKALLLKTDSSSPVKVILEYLDGKGSYAEAKLKAKELSKRLSYLKEEYREIDLEGIELSEYAAGLIKD